MSLFGIDFSRLSGRAVFLGTVFTVVETVVLGVWLRLLFPDAIAKLDPAQGFGAAAFLFVGLELEHLIALIAGKE